VPLPLEVFHRPRRLYVGAALGFTTALVAVVLTDAGPLIELLGQGFASVGIGDAKQQRPLRAARARALIGRDVMRIAMRVALLAVTALLLHAGIKVAHLSRGAGQLHSGEWTQADAEAIGAVWNLNGSRVDAATQPTNGE
jgi:hypothetical protein